jgi:hypothetical protein
VTDDTRKVPERKLRHSRLDHDGAGGVPLPTTRKPPAATTNIDNTAWLIKRSPDQRWPLRAEDTSPLQWWRTLSSDEFRDAEQLLLRATLQRIRVLRGNDQLTAALGGDPAAAIDVAFTLMPIETFTLKVDIAMTALARCAIDRSAAAALVMAQIIGLTEFDHGLAMGLAASWYARGRRYSSDPGKFSNAGTVLLAAILERQHCGGEA